MPDITVVIPVAPYHVQNLARALASVRAQTIPCETVVIYDDAKRGAGWARNEGLKQVKTPLVVFLDADDELLQGFAEKTLAAQRQTGRYVYCDFTDGKGVRYHTSECPWMEKRWHAVTTLLPTEWVRSVGGFDETMEYAEDTEFFAHLTRSGYCGVRLPEILFVYHRGGQRSQQGQDDAVRERIMQEINARYQEKIMGCCGNNAPVVPLPSGQTVKVRPAWGYGKRMYIGSVTRQHYGRIDSSYVIDIDPRDLARRPDLFTVIEQPTTKTANGNAEPKEETEPSPFKAFTQKLRRVWFSQPSRAQTPVILPEMPAAVDAKPNVERIIDFARKVYVRDQVADYGAPAVHIQRDPVFVFPDKEYPSYTDVRRLVELSGFEVRTMSETALFTRDTSPALIYLSPEQPFAHGSIDYRLIWWSLEYGGEYEPTRENLWGWRGELWASDPAWAAAHGAKMVVMGSHPGLNPEGRSLYGGVYEFLMLAYMTHRRQALQDKLTDRAHPKNPYPGYGDERHQQLVSTDLMLHAHQDEARRAIAPQRFALCAAYHLPLIHETVPDAGEYGDYAVFADYAALPAVTRDYLAGRFDDPLVTPIGERLHQWLCYEQTFRKSVMEALHAS